MKACYITENLEKKPFLSSICLEAKYLINVLNHINDALPGNKLEFYITRNLIELPEYENKIVFLIGDELYHVPSYYKKVKLIFKNYFGEDVLFAGLPIYKKFNIHGMPLPPIAYYDKNIPISLLPFEDRPIDIFFRGNNHSRPDFYEYMTRKFPLLIQNNQFNELKCDINFTGSDDKMFDSFRNISHPKGVNSTTFAAEMAASKVCLCPRGTSVETFRHTEALRSGCIIISEKLPKAKYYENCSFYTVRKDWTDLPQILNEIFDPANKDKILNTHKKMLQLWKDRFSEKAVANNIISIIETSHTHKKVF